MTGPARIPAIIAIILGLAGGAATAPAHASMDTPCAPIGRIQLDHLLHAAQFSRTGFSVYVSSDNHAIDISGMRKYCSIDDFAQGPTIRHSRLIQIIGPSAYYTIVIDQFRNAAGADRQVAVWRHFTADFPGETVHIVRTGPAEIVKITRTATR